MSLLTELETAGLNVRAYPDWDTRTMSGKDRTQTVGIINHWDAIAGTPAAAYYTADPPHNRYEGDLYHIVIRRDGTVDLLQQRYAWHAGKGSPDILEIAENGGPVPDDDAGDTYASQRINGNPHFFSVCINYHPNEGPVPTAQYDALVVANRVLMAHFNLDVGQVFRHMDWTIRKRDIDTISLEQFRSDIQQEASMPLDEIGKAVVDIAFNLLGAEGDKTYWYAKEPDDPEFANLRNAIVAGSARWKAHGHPDLQPKGALTRQVFVDET